MTRRFGTRWIRRRSEMDGVRCISTISTVVTTTGTTMAGGRHATSGTGLARTREDFLQHISIQQPLKQAMQFFAESVCRDEAVLDLRLSTTKRLMGSARLRRGGRNTNITTKAWRHLSWTFEEAPRLAARAAREHLNSTLFDETEMEQEEATRRNGPHSP